MTHPAQFWDQIADRYAAKPIADPAVYQRKLAITKAELSPTQTVLDIGCGTGSLALELAPHVAHVHAIDISSEMIRIANTKKAAAGIDNVTFHVGSLDDALPFSTESFAGVCAYSILHLVADRRAVLARVFDLLVPGGFFIASTVCLGNLAVPMRPLLSVMRWLGKAPRVEVFSGEELVAEFAAAGFEACTTPDVGAKGTTVFSVARKPQT